VKTRKIAELRVPPLYPLTRAHEVDSATRWRRLLAAGADSVLAKFGWGRTLMMLRPPVVCDSTPVQQLR
jgi:hypothetical protein